MLTASRLPGAGPSGGGVLGGWRGLVGATDSCSVRGAGWRPAEEDTRPCAKGEQAMSDLVKDRSGRAVE